MTTPDHAFTFPTRGDAVLGDLVERRAAEMPDHVFAVFEDAEHWSHGELAERT